MNLSLLGQPTNQEVTPTKPKIYIKPYHRTSTGPIRMATGSILGNLSTSLGHAVCSPLEWPQDTFSGHKSSSCEPTTARRVVITTTAAMRRANKESKRKLPETKIKTPAPTGMSETKVSLRL